MGVRSFTVESLSLIALGGCCCFLTLGCDSAVCVSGENGLECEIEGSYSGTVVRSTGSACSLRVSTTTTPFTTQSREIDLDIPADFEDSEIEATVSGCRYIGIEQSADAALLFATSSDCGDSLQIVKEARSSLSISIQGVAQDGSTVCEQGVVRRRSG